VDRRRVDFSARRLLLESGSGTLVLPSELGAGVSQLVPVVVAMLLPHHRGLVMVEQPEIHVQPKATKSRARQRTLVSTRSSSTSVTAVTSRPAAS
jgi:predicted ATPase